ncbi:MAG: HAMP domain-containing histidine kinase [Actinobacteria bacterium]|nr:HAMP domain-containing histidine kinase [Actinomycetota bacterium]
MAPDESPRPARRARPARLGTVRVRLTVAAVAVVGLALVGGSVGLVAFLRKSLTDDVRTAVQLRARDVAAVLESGTSPEALAVDDGEEALVQVVDDSGRVIASSPNLTGAPAVADLAPGQSARVRGLPIDDDEFLVLAVAADTDDRGGLVVLAGRTLEVVGESTAALTQALLLGVPGLLLVVGLTAWRLAGRALAPVEAIRAEVASVSSGELHRRVPVPNTDDEVARLASTMNAMLERLEAGQARERRFVSDASHELRSPLATIRQYAELALTHPGQTSLAELAEVTGAEGLRLQQIVDDLLFLAHADERGLRPTRGPVDLDDLVFEEAARLRATPGLRVDTHAVSAGRVVGDRGHLARLVRNLGDNAGRYAEATVRLSLATEAGEVILCVDDDGPGIPLADRERVFDRFVRLDEARTRDAGGGGLGLSIAAEIAAAHGGTIRAEDGPLGGARFEVRLPEDA